MEQGPCPYEFDEIPMCPTSQTSSSMPQSPGQLTFRLRIHRARWGAFLTALAALPGCNSGGSSLFNNFPGSGPGASKADFVVTSVLPVEGQTWQLNRPIEITFSRAVNFASVTAASLSIYQQSTNAPALGHYTLVNSKTIQFQPACPTSTTPPGLAPGGLTYVISIPASSTPTSTTISSSDGTSLKSGKTLTFKTPIPANPNDPFDPSLYYDTKVNQGPQVILVPPDDPNVPKIVTTHSDGTVTTTNFVNGSVPPNKFVGPSVYFLFTFNQPILPSPANVSSTNLLLQFEDLAAGPGVYSNVPCSLDLISNCVNGLAKLKVTPLGLLPAGRRLRFVVQPSFSDIKGETNFFATPVPSLALTEPVVQGPATPDYDAIIEDFTSTANLDLNAEFAIPDANWGAQNSLEAAFSFGGQESPLELVVNNGQEIVIDTSSTVLQLLDPLGSPVQVSFSGGNIYLRRLTVRTGGRIRGQGPNPLRFYVNETVRIENNGFIQVNGASGKDIATLLTAAAFTEPGGAGQCGGGDGGTGNPVTSQSTPKGGPGFGPFNSPSGGGDGGESALVGLAINLGTPPPACFDVEDRHPAGGGGGSYMTRGEAGYVGTNGTYPQVGTCWVALGVSAINPNTLPLGGAAGPQPFLNTNPADDFLGKMLQKQGTIQSGATVGAQTQITMTAQFANFFSASDVGRFAALYKATATSSWEDGTSSCNTSPEDLALCPRSRLQVRRITAVGPTNNIATLSAPTTPTQPQIGDQCVVLGTGPTVVGELQQALGGQGGGAGGNAVQSLTFPNPNYAFQDRKGAGGGGGGGILEIRALGAVLIFGGLEANGGNGAAGENTIGIDRIGGGSGGGSGGTIIIESSTNVTLFSGASNALIFARGGRRGAGAFGGVGSPLPGTGSTGAGLGRGGRGGKGLVQIHGPSPADVVFGTNQPSNSNFDPNPLVLFTTYGAQSVARSKWFDTGSGLAAGFPQYSTIIPAICPTGQPLCGNPGQVATDSSGNTLVLPQVASGTVANSKVTSFDTIFLPVSDVLVATNQKAIEPLTMLGDVIQLTTLNGTNSGGIVGVALDNKGTASPADDEFIFTTDNTKQDASGNTPNPVALNSALPPVVAWKLIPRYFQASTFSPVDGVMKYDFVPPPSQPNGVRMQLFFQGADAVALTGAVDPASIVPDPLVDPFGTPDLTILNTKRFVRFTGLFNIAASPGSSPSPSSPIPRLSFVKIPFRFN